jgi:uncharacterized protein
VLQVRAQQNFNLFADGTSKPLAAHPKALRCYPRRASGVRARRLRTSIAMQCFVYASTRKNDSYLWLTRRDGFEVLSESLVLLLGELRFVLEVQLDEERKLPVEDARQIIEHLRTQGWHLQLPPQETLAAANHPAYQHSRDDRDA